MSEIYVYIELIQYGTNKGLTYKQVSLIKSRVKDFYFGENNS